MQYITSYLFQLKYTLLNFKWQGDLRKRKNFQPKEEKKKKKIRIPIWGTNIYSFFRIYPLLFVRSSNLQTVVPVLETRELFSSSLSPPFSSKTYIQPLPFGVPVSLTVLAPSFRHLLSDSEQISTRVQIISPQSWTWPAETGWKFLESTGEGRNIQILLERVVLPLCFPALSHFRAKDSLHLFKKIVIAQLRWHRFTVRTVTSDRLQEFSPLLSITLLA